MADATVLTVIARNPGFYDNGDGGSPHRREGGTFVLRSAADFAPSWMVPAGWTPGEPPEKPTAKKTAAAES